MAYRARELKFNGIDEATAWMKQLGCDPAGIAIMAPKSIFKTICVESVPAKAANLLKQTFLAKGAEVAVTRGTADHSVNSTTVLICGTLKHYRLALAQLHQQPWGLPSLACAVEKALLNAEPISPRQYERNALSWRIEPGRTLIMGILNLTPDSFSDGGRHNNLEAAIEHAIELVDAGADILDIGAESTRPYGSVKISAEEEKTRLLPVLEKVLQAVHVPISIDTYKSEVAKSALSMGAHVLNDIWGLQRDPGMATMAARYSDVPVVLMHNGSVQMGPGSDIMREMTEFFARSVEIGMQAGIHEKNFIIDPGIGFGKNTAQNLEILGRLTELQALGYPILVGTSRKRFIGEILNLPVEERAEGTGATVVHAIMQGASIVRVHDVKLAKRMATMTDALQGWRSCEHG